MCYCCVTCVVEYSNVGPVISLVYIMYCAHASLCVINAVQLDVYLFSHLFISTGVVAAVNPQLRRITRVKKSSGKQENSHGSLHDSFLSQNTELVVPPVV